jgi:hypothetical protein
MIFLDRSIAFEKPRRHKQVLLAIVSSLAAYVVSGDLALGPKGGADTEAYMSEPHDNSWQAKFSDGGNGIRP